MADGAIDEYSSQGGMQCVDRSEPVLSFLDPATNACPFPAYEHLLREQPIHFDPAANFYIVSRYEDIRRILTDPKTFGSEAWLDSARETTHSEQTRKMTARLEAEGWVPPPNVAMLDDPRHRDIRAIFEGAFRPARVREMEEEIRGTARTLAEALPIDMPCEVVNAFSIPLPLLVMSRQVGVGREDIWRIKHWMDALIDRAGLMQIPEDEMESVDLEIEAQHYFKKVIDRLRGNNDGTVLGDLVNTPLSDGRTMSDAELLSNLMAAVFLAGTETTTNSISAGIWFLCQQPDLFGRLKSDPDRYMRTFIEEVLRLESPAQGIFRVVTRETEIHGVTLAAGSVLHLRLGAANRDDRLFGCPVQLDLGRKNAGAHLAFGSGIHHCIGAPLARRELHWAFTSLVERFARIGFAPEQKAVDYLPNYMFRSIRKLQVVFQ